MAPVSSSTAATADDWVNAMPYALAHLKDADEAALWDFAPGIA